jgi:hypothetical protein
MSANKSLKISNLTRSFFSNLPGDDVGLIMRGNQNNELGFFPLQIELQKLMLHNDQNTIVSLSML